MVTLRDIASVYMAVVMSKLVYVLSTFLHKHDRRSHGVGPSIGMLCHAQWISLCYVSSLVQ